MTDLNFSFTRRIPVITSTGININARRSFKATKIILRIKSGIPELVIPYRVSLYSAKEFLNSSKTLKWLEDNLKLYNKLSFNNNEFITILGKKYVIRHSGLKSRGIEINENELIIYGDSINTKGRVKRFLKNILKEEITGLVNNFSQKLKVEYKNITIKELTSRLGSCSSKGNLNFCLKLIFMDCSILEYVVAHEVAHLKEMNHSKKFWSVVGSIYPDFEAVKKMLKKNKIGELH